MTPQKKELKKGYLKIESICVCVFCLLLLGCNCLFQNEYHEIQVTRNNRDINTDTVHITDQKIINTIVDILQESKSEDMFKFGSHLHISLFSKEGVEKVYINGEIFKKGTKYFRCKYNLERLLQDQIVKQKSIDAIP